MISSADINETILFWINSAANKYALLDAIMIFSAVYLLYIISFIALFLGIKAFLSKRYFHIIFFAANLLIIYVLLQGAALLYVNERPFVIYEITQLVDRDPGRSFPSNHTAAAFAIAIGSLLFFHKKIGLALLVPALLIAFSRIYVGLHHPIDILGGIIIATTATLLIYTLYIKKFSS